ncbi:MAG: L,D-transpeptidase family protein [Candidatus Omnitrophica bacterium]|nr:L,D-transpeptidase family protein [Candidatus Omnitrophota bacterium]
MKYVSWKSCRLIAVLCLAAPLGFLSCAGGETPREVTTEVETGGPSEFMEEAAQAEKRGELVVAKKYYQRAKERMDNSAKLNDIQQKIEDVNIRILFSPVPTECSTTYTVEPNDALVKIAKKFDTTVNLIKRANNLESDIIIPGQELKVNTCPFSLAVDKSQNLLFLKQEGEILKTYTVSTGKNNSTPVGTFKVVNKLKNPTWFRTGAVIPPDSPENILGTRWMGFDVTGYGIHGTKDPDNLGKQVTLGCVRMRNSDVEELYDIIPTGTEVTIID